jgi:diguanylate cyclase (GGDEF)-like protein
MLKPGRTFILWRVWLPLLALAALAAAGVGLSIDRLSASHLEADARRTATLWSRHMGTLVPDLDMAFNGAVPSPLAQERLLAMHDMAGLSQFKLLSRDGQLLLDSMSIGQRPEQARPDELQAAAALNAQRSARQDSVELQLLQGDGDLLPLAYAQVYLPVKLGEKVLGVAELTIDQTELAATTTESLRRAGLLASLAMALTLLAGGLWVARRLRQHRQDAERAAYLAAHDLLTGALNRKRFTEELQRACKAPATLPAGLVLAVLCIDLDRFTQVNERHGHGTGDEILRQVAQRLGALLGANDRLARLAGDRFVILQAQPRDSTAVAHLAQRILDTVAQLRKEPQGAALATTTTPAGGTADALLTTSVGAAVLGSGGDDAEALLNNAELALQAAKAAGGAAWNVYDAESNRAHQLRRRLTQDLRDALAQGGMQLHYQGLFDAATGRLCGYEALARWPHPLRGFVPPSEFIPLAEEAGLIAALGRWVLKRACSDSAGWPETLHVAVNLSAAQFGAGHDLIAEVTQALAASGLPAQRLELEITESLLITDPDDVLHTLQGLQDLGARIAMDDFGTGFSSLSYLWRFPFNKLKIDRAFTQGLGKDQKVETIVRSTIALAHSLGMRVNAEGVETQAQHDRPAALGCNELQGFLMARPQPAALLSHQPYTGVVPKAASEEASATSRAAEPAAASLVPGTPTLATG